MHFICEINICRNAQMKNENIMNSVKTWYCEIAVKSVINGLSNVSKPGL